MAVANVEFADLRGRPRRRWRDELRRGIGRHMSLELFSRAGEEQSEEALALRDTAP
jgi:hypothetical protein